MELRRILWPTDFSGNAEKALPYVTSLSEKYSCEVHVLYVIEELAFHEPWYGEFDRNHIEKIHKWEEQEAKERLDQICENSLKGCPLYVRHIAIGDPAIEILKVIDQEGMDMVVMPTHGRRGYFSYGSVAEKIMRNSPVPVVMIPIGQKR
jgi:nucleotide-binding universal stress UspA family protein